MTQLKAGNVIGIIAADGTRLENADGSPLTWIIEDQNGEIHELQLTIGRMGTYAMFAMPAFRVGQEGDWGGEEPAGPGRQQTQDEIDRRVSGASAGKEQIPVAVVPARRAKSSAVRDRAQV